MVEDRLGHEDCRGGLGDRLNIPFNRDLVMGVRGRVLNNNVLGIEVVLDVSAIEHCLHVTAQDMNCPSVVSIPIDHVPKEVEEVRFRCRWEGMILGRKDVFEDVS